MNVWKWKIHRRAWASILYILCHNTARRFWDVVSWPNSTARNEPQLRIQGSPPSHTKLVNIMGFPLRGGAPTKPVVPRVHRVYRVHHLPCLHTVQRKHAQYFQLLVVYDANSLFCVYWLISCWLCQPDWTMFFILFFWIRHRMTNEVLHKEMLCFSLL